MMPKHFTAALLIICLALGFYLLSCKKEFSYEGGNPSSSDSVGNAQGSLQDTMGNCQDIVVSGSYLPDSALSANDFITVKANITVAGKYSIITDTVNGCWFMDTGTITHTGLQSFTLKGYGKPISALLSQFSVQFSGTSCQFTIPAAAATYTFNAPAGSCPNFVVSGSYHFRATLGIGDSVVVPITVFTPGTYSIQTGTVNGIAFGAKGIFTKTGNQTVTLRGSGMPTMKGINQLPLSAGSTTCSFAVDALLDTSMYWQFTAEGVTYSGLLDSSYGALSDTGSFIVNNPVRIFETSLHGYDKTGTIDSLDIQILLIRLNTQVTTGTYHTFTGATDSDFNGDMLFQIGRNHTLPGDYFLYSSSVDLKEFTIIVTSYDPVTKLLQGTFSGPVYKAKNVYEAGPIVNITNGVFKTYLAY